MPMNARHGAAAEGQESDVYADADHPFFRKRSPQTQPQSCRRVNAHYKTLRAMIEEEPMPTRKDEAASPTLSHVQARGGRRYWRRTGRSTRPSTTHQQDGGGRRSTRQRERAGTTVGRTVSMYTVLRAVEDSASDSMVAPTSSSTPQLPRIED